MQTKRKVCCPFLITNSIQHSDSILRNIYMEHEYIRPILSYSCHQLSRIPPSNFLIVCHIVSQLLMPQFGAAPQAISPLPGKKKKTGTLFSLVPAICKSGLYFPLLHQFWAFSVRTQMWVDEGYMWWGEQGTWQYSKNLIELALLCMYRRVAQSLVQ